MRLPAWYTTVVRRHIPLITLIGCQVLLAGLTLFLYVVGRPPLIDAYKDFTGPVPRHAIIALSSWYLPSLAIFPAVADLVALTFRKRSARNTALGVGLVVPTIGLAIAVHGIFVPLFQGLSAP